MKNSDVRQRFFIQNSPVRGDVVRLTSSYANVISQKDYPESIKRLLGEMLVSASLLMGTIKIEGRLSIQLQSTSGGFLKWAMAECDDSGSIRGLAKWDTESVQSINYWNKHTTANDAFSQLGVAGEIGSSVIFINIQPKDGQAYQGIVERSHNSLAECLAHYQKQSAQIPTLFNLACDGLQAGGLLVQMLPFTKEETLEFEQSESAGIDEDLWTRLTVLTKTVKAEELTTLESNEILYRLYHEEENIVSPDPVKLEFGCSCSQKKSDSAILQLGKQQALDILQESGGSIAVDCGFCGKIYQFNKQDVTDLFS